MHEMHRIIPCISWFYPMSLSYNTMNFFVLYHYEELPWYRTTNSRVIIPCFFLCIGPSCFKIVIVRNGVFDEYRR